MPRPVPVSVPVSLYSACTCILLAMTLAPARPTSVAEVFVLVLSSPVNALIAFNFIFMIFVFLAQITCRLVFGTLSDEEMAVVKESARNFIMFKSVYVFSALHAAQYTDLIVWMSCFLIFGWLRAFVALAYHRLSHLDYLQAELNPKRNILISFIAVCFFADITCMAFLINLFMPVGWRPLVLLLHEGGLTAVASICSIVLYCFQVRDHMSSADHTQKAFYLDSAGEIIIQTSSLVLLLQVWASYGLSLTVVDMFFFMLVRAVYVRISSRLASLFAYRRVLNDINTRFADATEQELAELDDHCAICHERLQIGVTKKLPCSHFFHLPCLRQWMKYRRTCPVCRSDLLNPGGAQQPSAGSANVPPGLNQWGLRRLLHFNTGNWASWMPNISLEVVRGVHVAPIPMARRGGALLPSVRILSEMFPNLPEDVLQLHLMHAQGDISAAIESLINGNNGLGNVGNTAEPQGSPENAADGEVLRDPAVAPSEEIDRSAAVPESDHASLVQEAESVSESTQPTDGSSNRNEPSSMLRQRLPRSDSDDRRMAAIARIEALARGIPPPH